MTQWIYTWTLHRCPEFCAYHTSIESLNHQHSYSMTKDDKGIYQWTSHIHTTPIQTEVMLQHVLGHRFTSFTSAKMLKGVIVENCWYHTPTSLTFTYTCPNIENLMRIWYQTYGMIVGNTQISADDLEKVWNASTSERCESNISCKPDPELW